jgi:hypothetical protein
VSDDSGLSWSFTNRILFDNKTLQSDAKQQVLHESGDVRITLEVLLGDKFTDAISLMLRGTGFKSADEATKAGRLWRQYVTVAFAIGGLGADFDPIPVAFFSEDERQPDPAVPGLTVYPVKGLRFEGWASGKVHRPVEHVVNVDLALVREVLPEGLKARTDLELAYRMFHLATQSDNIDGQYILLVTALEALIPDKLPVKEDADLVAAFDTLIAYAKETDKIADKRVRELTINALHHQKRESIINYGSKLATKVGDRTYDGLPPDEYFRRAYKRRSALVHGSLSDGVPLDREMISEERMALKKFVRELLAAEAGFLDETAE